ncbi:hypothetical protein MTsPCn9_15400 [Croceitalea sp. MTPC9]|uniref:DUF4837 family protein n=1 Tax=unclassified Croceitalea TaxID=2632280 RepID=UPI002B3F9B03|nr:hypothetical protein MTsPCn6_13730 [Croceitalea sp. MTPC6]GMN16604.1 hypothetical protein MTsPCn9_15400 [Croceitalea sp. MTPC9]
MQKLGKLLLLVLLVLTACKETSKNQKFLPPSTGAVNSLIVVMENDLWQGPVGDRTRELFADRVLAVPQSEAIFSLTQIPPQVFSGAVSNSRSVLYVQEDSLSLAHVKTNVYALSQKVAVVKGRNNEELLVNLDSVAPKAITAFRKNEIKEAQRRFKKSLNKETDLKDEFGISMDIPSVYHVGKHEDNFVWLDRQILKGNMNVIAYTMPNDAFSNDSTFVQDIVKMRDSIGKKHIPGPYEGTYMITEKAFSPYVFPAEVNGYKAAEVRGIWEVSGYPMAGPFLSYIINDEVNNRKLIIEGFIFAPSANKRDDLLELEAILKTLKIIPKGSV